MSIQLSTGLRTRLMGPEAFLDILPTCTIRVFTGLQPATADLAQQGQLLGEVTLNGDAGASAALKLERSGYMIVKPSQARWLMRAKASGVAGWFRCCLPSDAGASNTTAPRLDGAIIKADANAVAQMIWQDTSVIAGRYYPVDYFLFGLPPIGAPA
jgi:hypothetical protein